MADNLTRSERSFLMSKVRGKDTAPELRLRSELHRRGYRFRVHRKDLPGKPDLVFPARRKAIFVHGCFWHRHSDCKLATSPKQNREFWQRKFESNVERDKKVTDQLRNRGWEVLVLWQCEIEKGCATAKAEAFLGSDDQFA